MNESEATFGMEVYDALRAQSGFQILTTLFNYQAIQKLKSADRAAVVKLFSTSSYEVIQVMKEKSPDEIALFLVDAFEKSQKALREPHSINSTNLLTITLLMS